MKINDMLVESKKLDEANPLDYIRRTFGSNVAATKIDMEKDSKRLTKAYLDWVKSSNVKTPDTKSLFQFMQQVGLPVDSEREIIQAIRDNPSMSRKLSGIGKAVGGALKKGAQAVGKAMKGAEPIKPDANNPIVAKDSMYETIVFEAPLKPSDIQGIIVQLSKKGLGISGPGDVAKAKYAPGDQAKTKQGIRTTAQRMGSKSNAERTAKGMDKLVRGEAIPANLAKELAPFVEPLQAIMSDPQFRNQFILMTKKLAAKKQQQTQ